MSTMSISSLSSLERIKLALDHKEPDKVPYDLGGTINSGISLGAYRNLLDYLGMRERKVNIRSLLFSVAEVDEDVLERLQVDFRGVTTNPSSNWKLEITENEEYKYATDEWGIVFRMPREQGIWYDIYKPPLRGKMTKEVIDQYPWPNPSDPARVKNLKHRAELARKNNKVLVIDGWYDTFFSDEFFIKRV